MSSSAAVPIGAIAPPERVAYHGELWSRLEPVWSDLLKRTDGHSAFMSATWIRGWMEVFGPSCRPSALIWRARDDVAVGCALISEGAARIGPFSVLRVFLNATGAGQPTSEHNDVLVLPQYRAAVLNDLVRIVSRSGADEFALFGVDEEAARDLASRWPSRSFTGFFGEAPYVSLERLSDDGVTYLSFLSSNTRAQIRRSVRLYEERFGQRCLEVARKGEALDWFDQMVELHQKRWNARGKAGAFADPTHTRFHELLLSRAAGERAPDHLATDIMRIRFGPEVIGFLYNLRYHGYISFYQSGLRYHEDNRLKPGLVAHLLAVEHYLHGGAKEYDFLGGEMEAVRYKRSLMTDKRDLAWIRLPAPSLKMRLLHGIGWARRQVRSAWG